MQETLILSTSTKAAGSRQAKIMVNYHGTYKPTGPQQTYPNNTNKEGIRGLEWDKWHK